MYPVKTNRITTLLLPALAIALPWFALPTQWSQAAGQRAVAQPVAYSVTPDRSQLLYALDDAQSATRPAGSPCLEADWPGDDTLSDSDDPNDDLSDNFIDVPLLYLPEAFLNRLAVLSFEPIYHAPYIDPRLSPPT